MEGAPTAEELTARLDTFVTDGPISGVYWLPALDAEPPIGELDLAGWRELLRRRVKLLYLTMHHLGEAFGGSGTFLLSATRLGGRHGYDSGGAEAPMGGAVTGFTKAFKRENPDALGEDGRRRPGREPRGRCRPARGGDPARPGSG